MLADYLSWRLVFYINIPLVLYILHIFLFRNTIEPEITSEPFDLAGAITLALSTSGFMLSLAIAGHTMEWTSPLVIGSAALGVVSLAVFVRIERTSSYPLLNLNLLRNKPLTWSCLAQWGNAGVLMSAILFLPLYLIHVRGFSATGAGLTLLSTTLCAIASAVTLQKLMGKFGYKRLITLGSFGSVVLLTVAWWGFDQHTPLHTIVLFLCGLGFCFGMIMPVFSLVAQSAVEKKSLGTASSLVQFARELGFTTSTAILGTLMVLTLHSTLPQLMPADLAKGLGVVEFKDQQDLENQLSDRLNKLTKLADDDSEASREKLLSDPLVPGSLKEQIRGKQDVTDALHKLEIHYQEEIDRVLNTTLTRATAVTFVGGAFFALFCFLCCLRIPEIELKKE